MLYDDLVSRGDYICHHGIKGMRWGVRRYQNSDGSLTEAGKERYYHLYKTSIKYNNHNPTNIYNLSNNITKIDENTDVIKKSATLTRATTSIKESIDNRAKYLSLTDNNNELLDESDMYANWIFEEKRKPVYLDTYSLKKDVKIANKKIVEEYILSLKNPKISDIPMTKYYNTAASKSINNFIKKNKNLTLKDIYHKNDFYINKMGINKDQNNADKYLIAKAKVSDRLLRETISSVLYKSVKKDDIYKHFKDMGYDGIVDAEDSGDVSTYPLILFNPSETLRLENHKRW